METWQHNLRYDIMETRSPYAPTSSARLDRARLISSPTRHEGIGNALRAAFEPGGNYGLPDEMSKLLAKLDR